MNDALIEIDIKIESIKNELDILVEKLNFSLEFVEEAFILNKSYKDVRKFLKEAKIDKGIIKNFSNFCLTLKKFKKSPSYKHYIDSKNKNLTELDEFVRLFQRKASASSTNSKKQIQNMYHSENLVKNFRKLTRSYNDILSEQIFKNTQSIVVCKKIGSFVDPTVLLLDSIENSIVTEIKLNELEELKSNNMLFKSIKGLCDIDGQELLITDAKSNTIHAFDIDLKIKRSIRKIENERMEFPHGICYDGVNVCICDHNNNRIIITDKNLQKIKYKFGSTGNKPGQFECPIEACFYDSTLFVLDRGNKRIQNFSIDGQLIRIIELYKSDSSSKNHKVEGISLIFPLSFKMSRNKIAVLDLNKVYIYNFQGLLVQTLAQNNFTCISFFNDSLFTYSNDGYLTCFSKTSKNTDFFENYSYRLDSIKTYQISSMTLFNSIVILCSDTSKILAYF